MSAEYIHFFYSVVFTFTLWQVVIGPATVGGIQAGAFKIGDTAGTLDNIIHCKLYRPGSVGFVSKSVRSPTLLYDFSIMGVDWCQLSSCKRKGPAFGEQKSSTHSRSCLYWSVSVHKGFH